MRSAHATVRLCLVFASLMARKVQANGRSYGEECEGLSVMGPPPPEWRCASGLACKCEACPGGLTECFTDCHCITEYEWPHGASTHTVAATSKVEVATASAGVALLILVVAAAIRRRRLPNAQHARLPDEPVPTEAENAQQKQTGSEEDREGSDEDCERAVLTASV